MGHDGRPSKYVFHSVSKKASPVCKGSSEESRHRHCHLATQMIFMFGPICVCCP